MKHFARMAALIILGHIYAAALGIALPGRAHAQFFYSPPPPLMGQPSFHLYSVPGVMSVGFLGTYYSCTNVTSSTIRVGVEVFGAFGGAAANDPSANSLDIPAGGTKMFGDGSLSLSIDSSVGAGGITKGSARILATQRSGIICSAFIAATDVPPTSMVSLSVVKQTTQQGD